MPSPPETEASPIAPQFVEVVPLLMPVPLGRGSLSRSLKSYPVNGRPEGLTRPLAPSPRPGEPVVFR